MTNRQFDNTGIVHDIDPTCTDRQENVTPICVSNIPTKAIPVIFLPGILGSPLRSLGNGHLISKNNPWAWYPDKQKTWVALHFAWLGAAKRRILLNPAACEALSPYADDIDKSIIKDIKKALNIRFLHNGIEHHKKTLFGSPSFGDPLPMFSVQEALHRGWATVYCTGYLKLLAHLEHQLRYLTYSDTEKSINNYYTTYDNGGSAAKKSIQNLLDMYPQDGFIRALFKDFPEFELQYQQFMGDASLSEDQRDGQKFYHASNAMQKCLFNAAQCHYPVFAVGYNWLDSNNKSADYVNDEIQRIIRYIEAPPGKPDPDDLSTPPDDGSGLGLKWAGEVIVITHSMGGLVGRALANNHNKDLNIRGIVHGVQPCNGAATLYARMWGGWEGEGIANDIKGSALAVDGGGLIPILTQSPGAMELSPNHLYGANWLQIRDTASGKLLVSLPKQKEDGTSDPYRDIYLERKAWWRLADPEHMNPEETDPHKLERIWREYEENVINVAKKFHIDHGEYYHPNTYMLTGNFDSFKTWGAVRFTVYPFETYIESITDESNKDWDIEQERRLPFALTAEDMHKAVRNRIPTRRGMVDLGAEPGKNYRIQVIMAKGADYGDGTVPNHTANQWKVPPGEDPFDESMQRHDSISERIPQNIRYIFESKASPGFEHSVSYCGDYDLSITYYALVNILGNPQ